MNLKDLRILLKKLRGGVIVLFSLALLTSALFTRVAYARDSTEFEHPDYIEVELLATRYPLGPDRRPDTTKPKYESVVAKFKIHRTTAELIDCIYTGNENQFSADVNPHNGDDDWQFVIYAPANEPGGIANKMTYRCREIPTPGFTSQIKTDDNGVFHLTNTRKLGTINWTKLDAKTSEKIGGSEWLITGADGFSKKVVDNGENDEDPEIGSLKVSGFAWGVKKDTQNMWGTYALKETKAPKGYTIDENTYTFEFNENSDFDTPIFVGEIKDGRIPGELAWTKVAAENSELLGGSEWLLAGENGFLKTVVDNGENDEDPALGSLKVTGLEWGSYTLNETKAPEGYEINPETHAFDLTNTHLSAVLDPISNKKIPETPKPPKDTPKTPETPKKTPKRKTVTKKIKKSALPQTGDNSYVPFVTGAGVIVLLAGLGLQQARKNS